jgi:hypothetical protein
MTTIAVVDAQMKGSHDTKAELSKSRWWKRKRREPKN